MEHILSQKNPVHIHSLKAVSILTSDLCLDLPSGLSLSGFLTKILYSLLIQTRAVCLANLILLYLMITVLFKSINYENSSTHNFLQPPVPLSLIKYFSQHHSKIPSIYVLTLQQETKFHSHVKQKPKSLSYTVYYNVNCLRRQTDE